MEDYKLRKEEFVTNLSGSSLGVVCGVVYATVVLYGFWKVLLTLLLRVGLLKPVVSKQLSVYQFMFEYVCLFLTLSWLQTGLSHSIPTLNVTITLILVGYYLCNPTNRTPAQYPKKPAARSDTHLPYISVFRSVLMIMTLVAILAVDFPIFPRYFGKVETFGSSLMDLGVGTFVLSSGLVAGRSIEPNTNRGTLLKKGLVHSVPLWLLGLARLVSVKAVNYQEHASEYGIHWNFFLTLGTLPLTVSLLEYSQLPLPILSWLPTVIYEFCLQSTSLQNYILFSPRIPGDLVSLNREGLFSLWGYTSIFLLGKELGSILFNPTPDMKTKLLKRITIALGIFAIAHYGLNISISRRLANLTYVSWVTWLSYLQILGFWVVHQVLDISTPPTLHQAINFNGLALFLVANVLTGLINLSVPTLDVPDYVAYTIIAGYLLVIAIVSQLLYKNNIKLIKL